jgi:hypothetical protein
MNISQPERSQLDLAKSFNTGNDLLVYHFDEHSTLRKTRTDILLAFMQGKTCFSFRFNYKGRKFGDPKSPEDNIAIPPMAGFDEKDAIEMATIAHQRFQNTVAQLIAG